MSKTYRNDSKFDELGKVNARGLDNLRASARISAAMTDGMLRAQRNGLVGEAVINAAVAAARRAA